MSFKKNRGFKWQLPAACSGGGLWCVQAIAVLLFLLSGTAAQAQQAGLPPTYQRLATQDQRLLFLYTISRDSVKAGRFKFVPAWCHAGLLLTKQIAGADTLIPKFYEWLGDAYDGKRYDSAARYYLLALQQYKHLKLIRKIYLQQSLLYAFIGLDHKDSILHYTRELEKTVAMLPDTNRSRLNATNTIAGGYSAVDQYPKAIAAYRYVIRNALRIKDSATLRNAFVNTGNAYNEIADDHMAAYYTLQAMPYLGSDLGVRYMAYSNLSGYYQGLNNLDSARLWLLQAEAIARESKDEETINSIALRRSSVLIMEGKFDAANNLLARSLQYFERQEPSVSLVNNLLIYATLDTATNNYPRAKQHLIMLYDIARKMNQKAYLLEDLRLLTFVHERLGEYKEAFLTQKMLMAENDSLRVDRAREILMGLQTEYQTYRKEEQIKTLQNEARIRQLELGAAWRNRVLLIACIFVLIAGFGFLLYNRNLRSKSELTHLKAELEMKSLRSQMNPHFIFNSLNSIQKYIWENRQEDAAEYLTKFARLIRLVLENSQHASIPLAEELHALRLYIEMEHRRTNAQFDYSITVATDLDPEKVQIPPLLLQPYVENAIWHGLSQKDGRGKLFIEIMSAGGMLICKIDDNGIGRKRAGEIRPEKVHKTSLGMNISGRRIEWLQRDAGIDASVEIKDKQAGNKALGTTVIISLPLNEIT